MLFVSSEKYAMIIRITLHVETNMWGRTGVSGPPTPGVQPPYPRPVFPRPKFRFLAPGPRPSDPRPPPIFRPKPSYPRPIDPGAPDPPVPPTNMMVAHISDIFLCKKYTYHQCYKTCGVISFIRTVCGTFWEPPLTFSESPDKLELTSWSVRSRCSSTHVCVNGF